MSGNGRKEIPPGPPFSKGGERPGRPGRFLGFLRETVGPGFEERRFQDFAGRLIARPCAANPPRPPFEKGGSSSGGSTTGA